MIRLYMLPRCPYAHRAAFALREKGAAFEVVHFERGKRPPELEAVGPGAKSPTLFDDEVRVYDSSVVLEYLEERFPAPHLLPSGAKERADVRMLIARYNDEVAPKYGALLSTLVSEKPRNDEKVRAASDAFFGALPAWNQYFAGREYAVGGAFTLADITLYTFFPSLQKHGGVEIPEELTHLRGWHDRVRARPAAAIPEPK